MRGNARQPAASGYWRPARNTTDADSGAVLIEASICFLALFGILFCGIEYAMVMRASETAQGAALDTARVASASGRETNFYETVITSLDEASQAMQGNSPIEAWIFHSSDGDPVNSVGNPTASIGLCSDCVRLVWTQLAGGGGEWDVAPEFGGSSVTDDLKAGDFTGLDGRIWRPGAMNTCVDLDASDGIDGPDEVTILVSTNYVEVTQLLPFVPNRFDRRSSVAFEPRPAGQC